MTPLFLFVVPQIQIPAPMELKMSRREQNRPNYVCMYMKDIYVYMYQCFLLFVLLLLLL